MTEIVRWIDGRVGTKNVPTLLTDRVGTKDVPTLRAAGRVSARIVFSDGAIF